MHQALLALKDRVAKEEERVQRAYQVPEESRAWEDYRDPLENLHQMGQTMAVETNWVQSFILSFNSINSFGAFDIVDPGSIRYVISIAEQSNKQG